MASDKGRDFNQMMIDEDKKAQKWMQRFTMAAPLFTAPMVLGPFYFWMGLSSISVCIIAFYLFLIIMTEWSFYKAAFSSPGRVPASWSHEEDAPYIYPEHGSDIIPENRYCDTCDLPKPPRVAHCKYCNRCIPKMDHHCSWTANCVGEKNHKFFVLFLFYMTALSGFIMTVILSRVAALVINVDDDDHPSQLTPGQVICTIFLIIIATPTFIGVSSLLYTQYLVVRFNHTTLERFAKKRLVKLARESEQATNWKFVPPYSIDVRSNFVSVFGTNPRYWLVPITSDSRSDSDLAHWPLNPRFERPQLNAPPHG